MAVVWSDPFFPQRNPFWDGWRNSIVAGIIACAITDARMRLSVLVTLIGLVSEIRWVAFFGIRKRLAKLKLGGGVDPERRRSSTEVKIGPATSGIALHAAAQIPDG